MNNNEEKRRMSTEEKLIHYQGLREENAKLINMREAAVKESEKLQREVKNLTETNSKLNDALTKQFAVANDAILQSEKLRLEKEAALKEIEWQKEQKNRLREKLEDLRKNPISGLKNCMVWDETGVKRYNENGIVSVGMLMDGVLSMDYKALPIMSIGSLKSGKQPEPKYVYAILPYPNHKDMIIFKDADKAFETLNNQGPSNEHNLIMQRFEVKE